MKVRWSGRALGLTTIIFRARGYSLFGMGKYCREKKEWRVVLGSSGVRICRGRC